VSASNAESGVTSPETQELLSRLVACHRAAKGLAGAGLTGPEADSVVRRAAELHGGLQQAPPSVQPGDVGDLEETLVRLGDAVTADRLGAAAATVSREALAAYAQVLASTGLSSSGRAERFVAVMRILLVCTGQDGRQQLPARERLQGWLEGLLSGIEPPAAEPILAMLRQSLRRSRDGLLELEDVGALLGRGRLEQIRTLQARSAQLATDPEVLYLVLALEVDLHNFVEDCVAELAARRQQDVPSVRARVMQLLAGHGSSDATPVAAARPGQSTQALRSTATPRPAQAAATAPRQPAVEAPARPLRAHDLGRDGAMSHPMVRPDGPRRPSVPPDPRRFDSDRPVKRARRPRWSLSLDWELAKIVGLVLVIVGSLGAVGVSRGVVGPEPPRILAGDELTSISPMLIRALRSEEDGKPFVRGTMLRSQWLELDERERHDAADRMREALGRMGVGDAIIEGLRGKRLVRIADGVVMDVAED
jgi:hypothetical protein